MLDQEGSETATDPAGAGADGGGQLVKVGAGAGGGGARKVLGARELLQMVIARAPPRAPGILVSPQHAHTIVPCVAHLSDPIYPP